MVEKLRVQMNEPIIKQRQKDFVNPECLKKGVQNLDDFKDETKNNPIICYKEAIQFIEEKCDVSKEDIKKVLYFEEKYMESIGIIDEAIEEIFEL